MRKLLLLGAVAAVMGAVSALAQDTPDADSQPLTADLYLDAGFIPNPFVLPVISSGTLEAAQLDPACVGFVAEAPDVAVHFSGEADVLRFFFYGDGDSVMAVVAPDGSVSCNDDATPGLLQSDVEIASPAEGRYAVFVGSFSGSETAHGFLGITDFSQAEVSLADFDLSGYLFRSEPLSARLPQIDVSELPTGPTLYETVSVAADSGTQTFEVAAGGAQSVVNVNFASVNGDCLGFVSSLPLMNVVVSEATDLRFFAESADTDTTLLIIDSEGNAFCSDDASSGNPINLNPVVDIEGASGTFQVRVGTFNANAGALVNLTITDDLSTQPAVLAPAS